MGARAPAVTAPAAGAGGTGFVERLRAAIRAEFCADVIVPGPEGSTAVLVGSPARLIMQTPCSGWLPVEEIRSWGTEQGVRATTLVGRLIGVEEAVVEGFDIADKPDTGRLVLTATVRPYRRAKPRCSRCGTRCPGYDQGGRQRRWRALDLGEVMVYLVTTMFRVSCPDHGVVVARVGWAHPGSRFTAAFEDSAAWMSANMPATAVATFLRVTFRTVDSIVTRVVARAAGRVDLLDGLIP